jgi:uncharacterized protein YjbJ (UPF0337 family)
MHISNIPETDWKKVKTEIQKKWSQLSSDELEKTHGDVSKISSLVQKRLGLAKNDAETKLDDVIERCGTATSEKESKASRSSSDSQSSKKSGATGKSHNR